MSSSTAIPASEELLRSFAAAEESGNVRYIIVQIKNEVLEQVKVQNRGPDLKADYNTIASNVDSAAYILFNLGGKKNWLFITFVPTDSTGVRDKMVYAATKNTLKKHLGFQFFSDELHANNKEELTYSFYEGTLKPVNALSRFEEVRNDVIRQEHEEAARRETLSSEAKSSGYHSVQIPLAPSASDMLSAFKAGSVNFVELAIDDSKTNVIGVSSATTAVSGLPAHISHTEPRFYVYRHGGGGTTVGSPALGGGRAFFIYCCPDDSKTQLRMVYSTAKPTVAAHVKAAGITLAKKVEISDGAELTDAYFRELVAASPRGSVAPSGGAGRAGRWPPGATRTSAPELKNTNKQKSEVSTPHPVYSLMAPSPPEETNRRKNAKSIVLPPAGAYC